MIGGAAGSLVNPALPARLARRSKENFYNVFGHFDWGAEIPADSWWMSPELLTVHGTEHAGRLGEPALMRLSKWETINIFSVFTVGESDLIQALMERVHHPWLKDCFEYLIHFIDEENKHMWFFSEFCSRYGGKVYPQKRIRGDASAPGHVEDFLAFMRIVVFEEFGDRYNVRVMNDPRVPEPIRRIHRVHHQDECGHLAIGREISIALFERLRRDVPEDSLEGVRRYLGKYMRWILENAYNPDVYGDAGIPGHYAFRNLLMRDPARVAADESFLARIRAKFEPVFRK